MLCDEYIKTYDIDAHIADVRAIYRKKCELMLKTLDDNMPDYVKYTRPEGGLFLWCTLPDNIVLGDFVKRALAEKVAGVPGTAVNCDERSPSQSFRLTYATPSEEQIVRGVKIIAEIIKDMNGDN